MIEIIYLIPLLILIIVLFFAVISLKNNNRFLVKSIEKKELTVKELGKKLKETEETLVTAEKEKTDLSHQLEINSELLSREKDKNENLLKVIEELKKVKPEKEEDVIIEYFLKTKK
ncbi:hypothetical protein [Aquiflexum sp.]|uniref:hypothetical protein n=1 Tax=Aquiflexum sp. TaxID=1872584 RepID=UPI003593102D